MAGKPGRSGGKREGAGRKRRPATQTHETDPLEFLLSVMRGEIVPSVAQLDAAKTAARLLHGSTAAKPKGKKEQQEEAAKEAAQGRFKAASPPRLAAVDGKTVTDAA